MNPFQGSDGNWLSLNAKTATTASGSASHAKKAAEASLCANEGGKFWEYHDKLFANQKALGEKDLQKYAKQVELDTKAFDACLESGKYAEQVTTDMAAGSALGVTGTPGFFVNGRFLGGALPVEAFAAIIDEEVRLQQ